MDDVVRRDGMTVIRGKRSGSAVEARFVDDGAATSTSSTPATALLTLAAERGLDVERLDAFDSEYVPSEFVQTP